MKDRRRSSTSTDVMSPPFLKPVRPSVDGPLPAHRRSHRAMADWCFCQRYTTSPSPPHHDLEARSGDLGLIILFLLTDHPPGIRHAPSDPIVSEYLQDCQLRWGAV